VVELGNDLVKIGSLIARAHLLEMEPTAAVTVVARPAPVAPLPSFHAGLALAPVLFATTGDEASDASSGRRNGASSRAAAAVDLWLASMDRD
jgi:hypothetical protein